MQTWTYPDHHPKSDGPWTNEPDKAQWIDEATDLDCLAVRNRMGAWCGYVGVPPDHPLHDIDYDTANESAPKDPEYDYRYFDVHGGLTFSDFCHEGAEDKGPRICHIAGPGRPERVWWLGFDCAHGGDLTPRDLEYDLPESLRKHRSRDVYRDLDYVRAECAKLAKQLAEVT
jgi:hypothetical protein